MRTATSLATHAVAKDEIPSLEGRAALRGANRFVCMIAYTDYTIDARVRREAETLAANGFQVRCLTTKNGDKASRFVKSGVEVRELSVSKYRGKSTFAYIASYVRFALSASMACLRLVVRGELDVLHVHNIPDFLVVAGLLPRLCGRKVILDVHDSVPETFATKFSDRAVLRKLLCLEERLSALVAHKVICVNHPQRETLVARGIPRSKTFISMNVADPAIFKRPSIGGRPAATAGAFNLVYHGTMAERLGVDLIIRAVARLRERAPAVHVHLWGGGDDLAGFERLTKELGVEDAVFFRPKGYPLQELPGHLSSMDLGVVANRRSGACDLMLPVKLIEYVALGIPTVVPRLKTIEYYFSDDMVTYYEPENVQALADAIYRHYTNPATSRMQAERAVRFLKKYGWERQGAEFVNLYHRLMEN